MAAVHQYTQRSLPISVICV